MNGGKKLDPDCEILDLSNKAYVIAGGSANIGQPVQIELRDIGTSEAVAQRLASELNRLDGLVLNAGLGVVHYAESKDGIDTHMQVNVIAQHHQAMTLLDVLRGRTDSRLVLQSSEMHRMLTDKPGFDCPAELNRDIGPISLYNHTTLAQILLVRLMQRLKSQLYNKLGLAADPNIVPTHPGAVKTDQKDQAVDVRGTKGKVGVKPYGRL